MNKGRLCAGGSAFARDLYRPERVTKPAARKSLHDDFEDLESWEEALDLLADRLKRIRDQHGPETLFIDCRPAAGLDFYYAAMRFAALWGTPHLFSPSDDPKSSNSTGIRNVPDCTCRDWVHSRGLFIVGADPASTHPVAFRWALEAQKKGARIVVADTRFTRTMSKADLALRIRPDTANFLGIALMKAILDEDLCDLAAIRNRFAAAESWQGSFEPLSLEAAAETIGLSSLQLKEAAFLLSKTGPVQVITGKRLAHLPDYGIWRTMAAAMDWTGRKGGGWYPLDSGRPSLSSSSDLRTETLEAAPEGIQANSCATINDFFKKMTAGRINQPEAVICSGDFLDDSSLQLTRREGNAPFTAYFGSLANGTSHLPHLLFPAQAWAEQDSLFFGGDRTIQWGGKIVDPPEDTRSGLDFWMGLARRFGWDDQFPWKTEDGRADHGAFYDWLLDQSTVTRGCTLEMLRNSLENREFVHWPFDRDEGSQGALAPLADDSEKMTPTPASAPEATADKPNELYPLHLETPEAVSSTLVSADNAALKDSLVVQINPETALALGIETGDEVVLHSPSRSTEARAWITRMVPRWLVYLQARSSEKRVLVFKKGQSSQEALSILGKLV